MNEKIMIIDATDEIVIGGFGNLEGNLGLLKYGKEEIREIIIENNNVNDNIRLINSLLQSLKELKEKLEGSEKSRKDGIEYIKELKEKIKDIVINILNNKTNFDELMSLLEILDNKGSDK